MSDNDIQIILTQLSKLGDAIEKVRASIEDEDGIKWQVKDLKGSVADIGIIAAKAQTSALTACEIADEARSIALNKPTLTSTAGKILKKGFAAWTEKHGKTALITGGGSISIAVVFEFIKWLLVNFHIVKP